MAKKPIGAHAYVKEKPKKMKKVRREKEDRRDRAIPPSPVADSAMPVQTKVVRGRPARAKKKNTILNVLIVVCVIIFVGSLAVLGYQLLGYYQANQVRDELKNLIGDTTTSQPKEEVGKKPLVDYSKLYAANKDFVGWIEIADTNISYPVVKTTNNETYLDTDFYGKKRKLGTVFADYRNEFTEEKTSSNSVLYGHSAADGSYFAAVRKYKELDYLKKHPFVSFNTMYSSDDWVVIGAIMIDALDSSAENFMYQDAIDFADETQYNQFIDQVYKRNYFKTPVDCEFGDQFLTLSTCDYDFDEARFVLFARKLREGETTKTFDMSMATTNPEKVMPDRW